MTKTRDDDVIYADEYTASYQNARHDEAFRTAAKAFMNAPGTETEAKLREAAQKVVERTCEPANGLERLVADDVVIWLVNSVKKDIHESART